LFGDSFCYYYYNPFMSPWTLSGTTRVSRYQEGTTNLDLLEQEIEYHWRQLGHMQICTLPQIDTHVNFPPLSFYRLDALHVAQPTVSVA